ncbi:hypothetical protein CI109_100288 [Kwoniella shandongensis]|uniref:Uncharacterized protein n=1 Tax=Kwoniella shandongensis TaxID=1734106 RepID=A0A5M6C437_9TREE|nr:uncharacterized protein CI109_001867 [Kwoniella shandongensis]KAA5529927.1 hypothetical protein CI109_001867 [Kwoniella shandongensis]
MPSTSAHPHLHLLVPSSTPSISLEVRLYLPDPTLTSQGEGGSSAPSAYLAHLPLKRAISTWASSTTRLDELDQDAVEGLRGIGVERLVTAAHPWGRLGGSMLDPILSSHLLSAIYTPTETTDPALVASPSKRPVPRTALLTYNVRGIGLSQGSQPWLGVGSDPQDLGAVEAAVLGLLGESVKSVLRFGYSWGSLLVALAPPPSPATISLDSILLISPPITPFKAITLLSSQSFQAAVVDWVEKGIKVKLIHGTKDEFTSLGTFKHFLNSVNSSVGEKENGVERVEIEDADHLFRRDEGEKVREEIGKWLGWVVRD